MIHSFLLHDTQSCLWFFNFLVFFFSFTFLGNSTFAHLQFLRKLFSFFFQPSFHLLYFRNIARMCLSKKYSKWIFSVFSTILFYICLFCCNVLFHIYVMFERIWYRATSISRQAPSQVGDLSFDLVLNFLQNLSFSISLFFIFFMFL